MHQSNQLAKRSQLVRSSINRSAWRGGFLLIPLALALAWLALSPTARAVCRDGCGSNNETFLGEDALLNSTGLDNTAFGFEALFSNGPGGDNTAIGSNALFSNANGTSNTATGSAALFSNTTGFSNAANGAFALFSNTTGALNTANGVSALGFNTTGSNNTANGLQALWHNTAGNSNTANGFQALLTNTTSSNNTAIGFSALLNATGGSNIALGESAGINLTTGSNNIDLGNKGVAGESNTIRIGKKGTQTTTIVAGITGATVAGGVGVIIDSKGHLGTVTSSARYKEAIKPMGDTSDSILALKPVSFRYKKDLDPQAIPQFGLVAEDVAKVDPDLVAKDEEGKAYTVRYEAVSAMLLNEFLKEHKKVEEQAKTVEEQTNRIEAQASKIERLEAALEKVSARLDAKGL